MIFKRWRYVLVVVWMIFIFMMSHLDGAKSWFLTGEFLTVTQTGHIEQDLTYEEKMELYDRDETWNMMVLLRKFAHFFEYFILVLLVLNVFVVQLPWYRALCFSLALAVGYAVLDEVHQLFIPGRSGNMVDILIDALGAMFGALFVSCLRHIRKVKLNEN